MNDLVGMPIETFVCSYTLVFKTEESNENGFNVIGIAKFVDIAFNVIDEETGEDFCTEPITHSMN